MSEKILGSLIVRQEKGEVHVEPAKAPTFDVGSCTSGRPQKSNKSKPRKWVVFLFPDFFFEFSQNILTMIFWDVLFWVPEANLKQYYFNQNLSQRGDSWRCASLQFDCTLLYGSYFIYTNLWSIMIIHRPIPTTLTPIFSAATQRYDSNIVTQRTLFSKVITSGHVNT